MDIFGITVSRSGISTGTVQWITVHSATGDVVRKRSGDWEGVGSDVRAWV